MNLIRSDSNYFDVQSPGPVSWKLALRGLKKKVIIISLPFSYHKKVIPPTDFNIYYSSRSMFTSSVIETEHDRIRTLSIPETETTIEREK